MAPLGVLFDRHCPVVLLGFVLVFALLSACSPQVEKGYDMKVSLPVNGEITFH